MHPQRSLDYAYARRGQFVSELREFVRFPSVSADPRYAADIRKCASWLASHLKKLGLQNVHIAPTAGYPIVRADWLGAPGRPTVLVYGHYDVQPAEPLSAWKTPPFEPTIRGNDLFGRGAADDKGQLFTHVKAIECFLCATGSLPVNVKCLFEGEEEIGSPHLAAFLKQHARSLAADVAVLSDSPMLGPDRPAITESLRGGLSVELVLRGHRQDLHSGNFGGAVHNPLQALSEIIAGLHDANGRIAIAGFYDRVRRFSDAERAYMREVGPPDEKLLADAGAERGWGEVGYSLYERTTIRPALSINGLSGGYGGHGVKAIIPAAASAKLNFRLAPDQNPIEIDRLFRDHIARVVRPTMRAGIKTQLAVKPAVLDRGHPTISAAAQAYKLGFGHTPVFLRCGGTISIVNLLKETLAIPTVMMGFALPDDHLHGPNEKFHLPNYFRGIATSIHFMGAIAHLASIGTRRREPSAHLVSTAAA